MHRLMPPYFNTVGLWAGRGLWGAQNLWCLPPLDCRAALPLAMTRRLEQRDQDKEWPPLSSFSLGLDPRVHELPATPNGCPDQVRAKRRMGWTRCPPNPHPEPVEGRGFQHRACRPSFDRLRMRVGAATNPTLSAVIASGTTARQSRCSTHPNSTQPQPPNRPSRQSATSIRHTQAL